MRTVAGQHDDSTLSLDGETPDAEPRPLALAPGERLAGRYRVVRSIASGGMGDVYEAEDDELGGRVALKTVRAALAADGAAIDRFRREVHLARRVTHPSVCRVFDVGVGARGVRPLHVAVGGGALFCPAVRVIVAPAGEDTAADYRRAPGDALEIEYPARLTPVLA